MVLACLTKHVLATPIPANDVTQAFETSTINIPHSKIQTISTLPLATYADSSRSRSKSSSSKTTLRRRASALARCVKSPTWNEVVCLRWEGECLVDSGVRPLWSRPACRTSNVSIAGSIPRHVSLPSVCQCPLSTHAPKVNALSPHVPISCLEQRSKMAGSLPSKPFTSRRDSSPHPPVTVWVDLVE